MGRPTAIRNHVGMLLGYYEKRGSLRYLLSPVKRELGYYDERLNQTWQLYPIKKLLTREGDILSTLLGSEMNV